MAKNVATKVFSLALYYKEELEQLKGRAISETANIKA